MESVANFHRVSKTTDRRAGVKPSLELLELGYASALLLLLEFKQLMQTDGLVIDCDRMRSCSAYALEQLGLAHTSNNATLRQCAMRVFALLQD